MIETKNIEINIPGKVKKILEVLRENGYEAYVVGGCVRDSFIGRIPGDWDITTSALPENVKSLFSNTVDTGIEHGTVMVLMGGEGFEVTTYRVDGKYSDGRHPDKVEFTPSLEEDLKRRDFTINAFAYSPETGVVDLFDGMSDLEQGIIRCVGEPDRRFGEDALRIMRAVRFAAQLSFTIETETYEAISRHAENLGKVSAERVRVEFEKTLMSDNPSFVNMYRDLGLAKYIIRCSDEGILKEAYNKCFDTASEKMYATIYKIVAQREEAGLISTEVDEETKQNDLRFLRLAAFFKNLDYNQTQLIIRKLTYDNKTRTAVSKIIKYMDEDICPDRKKIKWALYEMGTEVFDLVMTYKMAAVEADSTVRFGDFRCAEQRYIQNLEDIVDVAEDIRRKGEPFNISMLAVTGKDLIAIGVPVGEVIGQTMDKLLAAVIDNPGLNTKEQLLKMI